MCMFVYEYGYVCLCLCVGVWVWVCMCMYLYVSIYIYIYIYQLNIAQTSSECSIEKLERNIRRDKSTQDLAWHIYYYLVSFHEFHSSDKTAKSNEVTSVTSTYSGT